MMHYVRSILCATVISLSLGGCQMMIPEAQGLKNTGWVIPNYERQDQVEIQWKQHSFSFLLYQQQKGQILELIALSLTGQPLFKVQYDGQEVKVLQRIDAMKLLPFDYLVRDVLYATYPLFAQLQASHLRVKLEHDTQKSVQTFTVSMQQNQQQNKVFVIRYLQDRVELDNVQVPYQMVLSEIDNTLEHQE